MTDALLAAALRELNECLDDWHRFAPHQVSVVFRRFVTHLNAEPLLSALSTLLPTVDFDSWWRECEASKGGLAGSGTLLWPSDRHRRVAVQVALCRAIADGKLNLDDVAYNYLYWLSKDDAGLRAFRTSVLEPLCRDVGRITQDRSMSIGVSQVTVTTLPSTDDAVVDQLLGVARDSIRSASVHERQLALEKLWDAWERLKTLEDPSDKKSSSDSLLQFAGAEPELQRVLNAEARALTEIGNTFHIRHFEAGKTPLTNKDLIEYFYLRLWALIELLVVSRARARGETA